MISKAEIARSLELYLATKRLQREETARLELTKEPLFRNKEDVARVVVAFGSYDPLTKAHEALFMRGLTTAGHAGLDELLIATPTVHFDKKPDWTKNAAIYDRVHALEGFASCYGNVALGLFNRPFFADLIDSIKATYKSAQVYFVVGVDVLEKIVDPAGYSRKGLDPDKMIERSMQASYLVSERTMKTDNGLKVVTLDDLRQNYPVLQSEKVVAIDLHGDYPKLGIPIQDVSSTLIRNRRNAGLLVEHLEAIGISEFVDRRSMYLQNRTTYAALVYARQRFADQNEGNPIATYIDQLMDHLRLLEGDPSLRAQEIRMAERIS
ncbi:hypothetical protein HYX12_04230 [Candidatus Woesearchaeota archaeon]|nr:hypothetical protein [Candidatus Woesearchaeota archaeon]